MINKRSDEWETPKWLMKTFMEKCYDPCPKHRASYWDGLMQQDWNSPAYVNPPYSDPASWVEKAIEQQERGCDIIMLLRCDPSTKWYKKLVEADAHFAYFNERLKFSESKGSPNFASMLVFLEGKHG